MPQAILMLHRAPRRAKHTTRGHFAGSVVPTRSRCLTICCVLGPTLRRARGLLCYIYVYFFRQRTTAVTNEKYPHETATARIAKRLTGRMPVISPEMMVGASSWALLCREIARYAKADIGLMVARNNEGRHEPQQPSLPLRVLQPHLEAPQ